MYKCKDWSEESNGEQWKTVYDIVLCRQTFEFFALWVNIWSSSQRNSSVYWRASN